MMDLFIVNETMHCVIVFALPCLLCRHINAFLLDSRGSLQQQHQGQVGKRGRQRHLERRRPCRADTSVAVCSTKDDDDDDSAIAAQTLPKEFTEGEAAAYSCRTCQQTFSSRNALFRHLRSNANTCGDRRTLGTMESQKIKQSIALQFGYFRNNHTESDTHHLAQEAGRILEESLVEAMATSCDSDTDNQAIHIISHTQSSIARLRPKALQQDPDVDSAPSDVLVLSVRIAESILRNAMSPKNEFLNSVQTELDQRQPPDITITLKAIKFLDEDMPIHAERSCTQLAFHYLLPLQWLPKGDELLDKGWTQNTSSPPPTESLRALKRALRSAESTRLSVVTEDGIKTVQRVAHGRFGALAHRERRPWHNFCTHRISPNHDVAWRVIDRCRIVGFVQDDAIVEVRGDEFLQGQVRAIVGTAVAMANGWLPANAIQTTTSKDLLVSVPLAPAGRTYLSDSRFHFEEMRTGGKSLFESSVGGTVLLSDDNQDIDRLCKIILKRETDPSVQKEETKWLDSLELKASSTVAAKLQIVTNPVMDKSPAERTQRPSEYTEVLKELQSIVESGSWPDTSSARQSVIKSIDIEKGSRRRGSFTIVNPMHEVSQMLAELPLGNAKFPDLVQCIFSLEASLGQHRMLRVKQEMQESASATPRPSSSHCAVNCDAQFTPHVDSGRGKGQHLSMIVGLGNYTGGDLVIEGESYNIQYNPIEFDGWKLRHWTAPFEGQRFSLVWFTPDLD